jgi:hypothetical protein
MQVQQWLQDEATSWLSTRLNGAGTKGKEDDGMQKSVRLQMNVLRNNVRSKVGRE